MIAGQRVEGIGSIDEYGASCRDGEGIGLDVADRSVRIFRVEIGYEAGSDAVAKQTKTRRSLPEREKRTSQPLRPRPGNQTVVFGCRPGAMRGGVIKPDFYASSASRVPSASNVGIIEISGGRILRLEQAPHTAVQNAACTGSRSRHSRDKVWRFQTRLRGDPLS